MGYDHREISYKYYEDFDEKTMRMSMYVYVDTDDFSNTEELVYIPCIYVICDVCAGKGRHVNPGIDRDGLTREDFDEHGPEFYEDYISGMYDVDCVSCHGRRVVPEPDYHAMDSKLAEQVQTRIEDYFRNQREMHHEREMGY